MIPQKHSTPGLALDSSDQGPVDSNDKAAIHNYVAKLILTVITVSITVIA